MSKSVDAQLATSQVLAQLVSGDSTVESLIDQAAADYDLQPNVIRVWLGRSFPSQDMLAEWRTQMRQAAQNRATFEGQLDEIRLAARDWALNVWKNCEPNGEPDWGYCCNRFLETKAVQVKHLRKAASDVFREVGGQYEAARVRFQSEHGSH